MRLLELHRKDMLRNKLSAALWGAVAHALRGSQRAYNYEPSMLWSGTSWGVELDCESLDLVYKLACRIKSCLIEKHSITISLLRVALLVNSIVVFLILLLRNIKNDLLHHRHKPCGIN